MQHRSRDRYEDDNDSFQKILKYCLMFFCCPCFTIYYILKAIWDCCLEKCIEATLKYIEKVVDCICGVLEKIFNFIFKYIAMCLEVIFRCIEKVLTVIFKAIQHCFEAIWKCIRPCVVPILNAINAACVFIYTQISLCLKFFYRKVLKPIWRCICKVFEFFIKVAQEFGRLFKKYIIDPICRVLTWIFNNIIKPIFAVIDMLILRPIGWVLKKIKAALNIIWDFFDDIMIEVCYDGYEYRERKREKEERKLKAIRKSEMNKHKTQKFSHSNTNKPLPKEYVDFFGGNPDAAAQYVQASNSPVKGQHSKNFSGGAPDLYLYNQSMHQTQNKPKSIGRQHIDNYLDNSQQPHKHSSPRQKHGSEDPENFYVCPNCRKKIAIARIDEHGRNCSQI